MDKIEKFLRKIDAKLRGRILEAIASIQSGQLSALDIKPLKGYKGCFRCRIGDIRILFARGNGKNIIFHIEFRGQAYK